MSALVGIGKSKIERMCRAAGVVPVKRATIARREVFIADGFSAMPHVTFQKFDVDWSGFAFGAFATFWWVFENDDKMSLGRPLFFDAMHDPGYSADSKRDMRVRAALADAQEILTIQNSATKH